MVQSKPEKLVIPLITYFPVSFYAVILGMTGFAIALQKIEQISGLSIVFSQYILYFVLLAITVISLLLFPKKNSNLTWRV
jgi:hypothetical protein